MEKGLPIALINGIEKFGAVELAILLANKDINIVGVGEYCKEADQIGSFEYKTEVSEVEERVNYVFDFGESEEVWRKAEADGAKLTIIGINRTIEVSETLKFLKANWRIINFHGIYGGNLDEVELKEIKYLDRAIKQAVGNENLILPKRNEKLRLLAVGDMTEAAMRASFLSGTEKEVFEIWGRVINTEEIAKVLVDEAKMTRFRVKEEEMEIDLPHEEVVMENWKKLRWMPKIEFGEGIEKTLQEYFSKADEEVRGKNSKSQTTNHKQNRNIEIETKKEEERQRFEIMVSEEEIQKEPLKEKVEVVKEEEVLMEEEFEEVKPLIRKNWPDLEMEKVKVVKKETEEKAVRERTANWLKIGSLVLVLIGLASVGLMVSFGIRSWKLLGSVGQLKGYITERKYDEVEKLVKKTVESTNKEKERISSWGLNRWVWGRRYQMIIQALEQGMIVGGEMGELGRKGTIINEAVFKERVIDWPKELEELKKKLAEVEANVGLLQARLSGDWNWVPSKWRGGLNGFKGQMVEARNLIAVAEKITEVLPEILGTDGKRREYMVLLQNENELRPGGGFIGSYAILSLEKGKLLNFDIKDIYEADGQLKGHVEPPEPIKNYLGEAGWYMRDANWQADFGASAKDIQWFLEKETGRKVDGVIGVNLAAAKAILTVAGEIYIPDFKEKINKNNLYEQAEFYAETKFFPGSKQKASFLGGLGRQLFEEIKNMKTDKQIELLEAMIKLLDRNEIQLALNNKKAAGVVADLGWNGAMYEGKCVEDRCFADYLYLVEANLGVNKANYFLYRSVDMAVDISNQTISRVLKINYENTAKNTNWPGGDYKNYMRVYIPATANVAEVSVSEGKQSGVKTIYQGESVRISQNRGKKEIGFLVMVPVDSKRTVEIRYVDQINLGNKDSFSYLNYIQKQSGYGDTGWVTLFGFPEGWEINQVEPEATLVNGKVLFNQKLDRDIKMGVEISK